MQRIKLASKIFHIRLVFDARGSKPKVSHYFMFVFLIKPKLLINFNVVLFNIGPCSIIMHKCSKGFNQKA